MKKFIILIISIFLLSGCSYSELNDLAVVSVLGIDYEDNEFKLTAQVMDIKNNGDNSTTSNTLIYESSGKTVSKAIRNFSVRYPKNVYLGHLEFIIIDKDAVLKINDIFDYIMRSPEVRSSSYVLFTKDETANEVLKPYNEVEDRFPVESLKTVLLDAKDRSGTIYDLTLEELLSNYLKPGIDPLVPIVEVANKKKDTATSTIIDDLAPIKNNKILSSLSKNQAIAYNTINNNFYDMVIDCNYKDTVFGALVYNPKSNIDLKINNNKIKVSIEINIESKIIEISNETDLLDKDKQKEIKNIINKEIENYVNDLIKYMKENNTDALGLKNMIYRNYYKKYNKYENKNIYENATFDIKINNKMYRFGNINKGA